MDTFYEQEFDYAIRNHGESLQTCKKIRKILENSWLIDDFS